MTSVNRGRKFRPGTVGVRGGMSSARRGMLLVVVLVIITVLGVLGTSFSYLMNADLDSVAALMNRQQSRMAAEAGLDRAILLLRTDRLDMDKWYNNSKSFRRILVWAKDKIGGSESLADQEKIEGQNAWRFSIVGNERIGEQVRMRYGMTDECSKLNINLATREQLLALFDELVRLRELDLGPSRVEELADSIIDWRDTDDKPNSADGAETDHYMRMEPQYQAKNRPFETVEELLMVRGFNGVILYGEDQNRNGYLDPNEDDGPEGAFPPDNADGILSRGILSYITVYSWDFNTAMDNGYKININLLRNPEKQKLPKKLTEEADPAALNFIAQALKRGYKFKSIGELVGLLVYEDGSSNYDEMWNQYASDRRLANLVDTGEEDAAGADGPLRPEDVDLTPNPGETGGGMDGVGRQRNDRRNNRDERRDEQPNRNDRNSDTPSLEEIDREIEELRRQQGPNNPSENSDRRANPRRRSDPARERGGPEDELDEAANGGPGGPPRRPDGDFGSGERDRPSRGDRRAQEDPGDGSPDGSEDRPRNRRDRRRNDQNGPPEERWEGGPDQPPPDGPGGPRPPGDESGPPGMGGPPRGSEGSGGAQGRRRGQPLSNPISADMMPVLMDRLTTMNAPVIGGLINVNTAPAVVLGTLPGLTRQDAEAIVAQRAQMTGEDKKSPAWVLTTGVISPEKFAMISNLVTTRSIQFSLDIIGFSDEVGAATRLQAVVELRGQLSQIKYIRDISSLGLGYPVWDDQRSEGFAFNAR